MTRKADGYGKDLRMMRNEKRLSQKEIASLINLSTTTVSKLETGQQAPSLCQITDWANACGFELKIFFHRTEVK